MQAIRDVLKKSQAVVFAMRSEDVGDDDRYEGDPRAEESGKRQPHDRGSRLEAAMVLKQADQWAGQLASLARGLQARDMEDVKTRLHAALDQVLDACCQQ